MSSAPGALRENAPKLLLEHGVEIRAWVDIDPKKIGQCYDGRPVIPRADLPGPDNCFVLSYVGSRGAAAIIRNFLEDNGYSMGPQFSARRLRDERRQKPQTCCRNTPTT